MNHTNPKTDLYISRAEDFARPVLEYLRKIIHEACPEVEETIKWGFPNFDYHGGILCSMASFKHHCAFGFWKASIMKDPDGILHTEQKEAMGHLGQIRNLKDLPSEKILKKYIKEAMRLNEEGIGLPARTKTGAKKELVIPSYFTKELAKNKAAKKVFEAGSYSFRKEYIEWITGAKTEETRLKRLNTAIEWMAEGKGRNWKYEQK